MTEREGGPCENTDKEIWREREGDFYADSIHVTEKGNIGINCGGTVIVLPVRKWHALASDRAKQAEPTRSQKLAEAGFTRRPTTLEIQLKGDGADEAVRLLLGVLNLIDALRTKGETTYDYVESRSRSMVNVAAARKAIDAYLAKVGK